MKLNNVILCGVNCFEQSSSKFKEKKGGRKDDDERKVEVKNILIGRSSPKGFLVWGTCLGCLWSVFCFLFVFCSGKDAAFFFAKSASISNLLSSVLPPASLCVPFSPGLGTDMTGGSLLDLEAFLFVGDVDVVDCAFVVLMLVGLVILVGGMSLVV